MAILIPINQSQAADTTWTGAVSTDWATAGNWSLNAVPTSADNVIVPDALATDNDPNVGAGVDCNNLTIEADGILNGNGCIINVYGNWTNNGTFIHNGGRVTMKGSGNTTFIPGSSSYYHLESNKTSGDWGTDHLSFSGTVEVLGNFYHTDGRLLSGQINLAGDYIIGSAASSLYPNATSTIINLNHSTNDQDISTSGGVGAYVQIDKAGGSVSILSDVNLGGWIYVAGVVNNLDIYDITFTGSSNGVFTPGGITYNNVIVNYTNSDWGNDHLAITGTADVDGDLTQNNGRLLSGQINLAGNYIVGSSSSGSYPYSSATIINFNDTSGDQTIICSGGIGAHLYIDKASGSVTLSSDIGLTDWNYIQGAVNGLSSHTLTFGGQGNGVFVHGGLTYGNIVVNSSSGDDWDNVVVGSGTLNISGSLTVTDGELKFNTNNTTVNVSGGVSIAAAGTLDSGTNTITVNGNWTNSGTFSHGSGRIVFAGSSGASTIAPGSSTYYDIELNKTNNLSDLGTLYIPSITTVSNDFIQTDGELGSGQLNVAGDYIIRTNSGGVTAGYSSKVNLNGTGDQSIVYETGGIGAKIRIDKASGTLTISDDLTLTGWEYIQGDVTGTDTHTFTFGDNTSGSFIPGGFTYGNIILNKTFNTSDYDFIAVSGTANVAGNFTHIDGTTQGGQLDRL